MASQYTNQYLSANAIRGDGQGLTVRTFLSYTLRGKAKQYSDNYVRALENDLMAAGGAVSQNHNEER